FNVIVSYLYDPDDIFKTNVGRASTAQFIQGQHRPKEDEHVHATAVFLEPLERLAIFDADPIPRLSLPVSHGLRGHWLAVHPGSGSEKKNWPEEKWGELLRQIIAETSFNILLLSGEAEGNRVGRISEALPAARTRLAHNLPLSDLARLLAGAKLFI